MNLVGKIAFVTGGSRGIGRAIALRLAGEGADVALTYKRAADSAVQVVREIEAMGRRGIAIQADNATATSVADAVAGAAKEFGRLDILVNSAGIFPYGPIEDMTMDIIDETLAIHVRAVAAAIKAALPHMTQGGRIISIGSSVIDRVPDPGLSIYAMSKSALVGLTKGLARDLGPRGITVNIVNPGPTDTDMNPADGPGADTERSHVALGHYAETDDIAATVAHLAGPNGRYITGTAISVDGGWGA